MSRAILMLVEDPGAANFAAPMPAALGPLCIDCHLLANGGAADQLARLGQPFHRFDNALAPSELIAQHAPRLVAVGTSENPDGYGLRLIDTAREAGIPTVGLVDGPASAAYRFRGRGATATAHAPDHVLVPDEPTRQDYIRAGFAAGRVHAVGHPLYDRVRAARGELGRIPKEEWRRTLFPQIPAEPPLVLFLAELSSGLDEAMFRRSPDYTLHGRGISERRTDIVLEEVIDALAGLTPEPALVLRLHPKTRPADFCRYLVEIAAVSEGGSPWEAVMAADLVIGLSTILLVEAALLGRPTLSVLPRPTEARLLPTIAAGITPCATRRDEVASAVGRALREPAPLEAKLDRAFPPGGMARAASLLQAMLV